MGWRAKCVISVVAAIAVIAFLEQRSFTEFRRARLKIVESAVVPVGVKVELGLPARVEDFAGGDPDALIIAIENSGTTATFNVDVDGSSVCQRRLGTGRSRIDCSVAHWSPRGAIHTLEVVSSHSRWALAYVEIATHHGSTSGLNYLVVLPRSFREYTKPPWMVALSLGLAVLALMLCVTPAIFPRWIRILHRLTAAIAIGVMTLIVVSPYGSQFVVLVSTETVFLWLAVIFAARLWPVCQWIARPHPTSPVQTITVVRSIIVALLVVATFATVIHAELKRFDGNVSGLLLISQRAFESNPIIDEPDRLRDGLILQDNAGYDGQFMYYMAFDPLLLKLRQTPVKYRDVVDAPLYRFGRIGFSLLTRLLSNDPSRFPGTMLSILLVAVGGLAFALSMEAQSRAMTPLLGGLILLVPGFWGSLLNAVPEPLAAVGVLLAVILWQRDQFAAAGLVFGFSLLVRETGAIFVLCVLIAETLKGRARKGLLVAGLAFGPVVLWRLYVAYRLFPGSGLAMFTEVPRDLGAPLVGIRDLWTGIMSGSYFGGSSDLVRAGLSYPVVLVLGWLLVLGLYRHRPTPLALAGVLYGLIALSFNYRMVWVHVGNAERITYELFVALILCSLSIRSYSQTLQRALVLFWCASAWFVFYGAPNAASIRGAFQFVQ